MKSATLVLSSYVVAFAAAAFWGNITPDLLALGLTMPYINIVGKLFAAVGTTVGTLALVFGVVIPAAVKERLEPKSPEVPNATNP